MSDLGAEEGAAASLEAEDLARANHYGMISRLFYAPADPNLLAEISGQGQSSDGAEPPGDLVAAWRHLQHACRGAYPALVRQEYDAVFVGVGKAEVTPYLSAYAEPVAPERFLVRLRDRLSELGLGRRDGVFEMEDHVSGISDVMRWLIESGQPLAMQQEFFNDFAYAGAAGFFAAAQNSPTVHFYREVAAYAAAFFELERTAFEMVDDL